ncbi:hypothetical protein IscW_ISCW000017 [Ixodes scapularis]|uniref:Uncharacterized protein n=1 Tax=Ixodes scapularis TaxID=6945 RepID=B7P1V2_IXOSC|nr:hypothetical protein IscW_ISCW000017 [Ixodes scapularis]|eukprot:XP_002433510.1 hypothetical protein IscW_ISCW000017 [Ixodes scapularis]
MQVLVHDVRFTLYNVCYKRLLLVWVLLGFFILLCLLFSGVRGLALFGGGVVWLVVNAMGIFVCMWLKFKRYLYEMLENQDRQDALDARAAGDAPSPKYAEKLLLRYSQRWVKEFVRKRLDLNMPVHPDGFEDGPCPPAPPRHCAMARCPCQFIEEHLRFKPLTKCSLSELCF